MWPRLNLNLNGILLTLRIKNYQKPFDPDSDWTSAWCKVDFSFISEPWLHYRQADSEVFLAREIDTLSEVLQSLLTDGLTGPMEFICMEPDFYLVLHPKRDLRDDPRVLSISLGHELEDIRMEWRVSFWNEGLTKNHLSVSLAREEIEALLTYLRLISGQLSESDPAVGELIRKNIIDWQ